MDSFKNSWCRVANATKVANATLVANATVGYTYGTVMSP